MNPLALVTLHPGKRHVFLFLTLALFIYLVPSQAQMDQSLSPGHTLPTHHMRPSLTLAGSVPKTEKMRLAIMLPLHNQAELSSLLSRLYDPSSPDYRKFLSLHDFTERFAPPAYDYQTVLDFARANGFSVVSTPTNRLIVDIEGTVEQVEKTFNVSMNLYQHPTENRTYFAPDREPSVALETPLWHVAGLDNYSLPRPMLKRAQNGTKAANVSGSGPGGTSYLAGDMRPVYYGGTSLTGSGQAVGLVEFNGYDISDVTSTFDGAATATTSGSNYILTYTTNGVQYNIPIVNVLLDGATSTPTNSDEAEVVLDIAQPIGMAPGLSQVSVYIAPGSTVPGTGDVDIFNQMALDYKTVKQLSCSWNWTPADYTAVDPIFEEMAVQGQTLFVASGDWGSWPNGTYYYPEEDSYVTAVGGTSLTTNGAGGSWLSETAWRYSGGGVNPDGITIPSWQSGLNGAGGSSYTLRNAPDVAAEGDEDNYVCSSFYGGCYGGWGGTSFAAPRWAGFMALVNQQATLNGSAGSSGGIGFINPAVYSIGEGANYISDFHDITSGSNGAYSAGTGYDLVTGWGSPKGQSLIDALAPGTGGSGGALLLTMQLLLRGLLSTVYRFSH